MWCLATSAQKHVAGSTALVRREAVDPKSKYAGLTNNQNEKIEKDQIFMLRCMAQLPKISPLIRGSGTSARLCVGGGVGVSPGFGVVGGDLGSGFQRP